MGRPNEQQTKVMAGKGFMLAAEAASASGWALSWVHRQAEAGKLEGEKAGGTWYVRRTALASRLGPTLTAAAGFLTPAEFRATYGREPGPGEARGGPQEARESPEGVAPSPEATPAAGAPARGICGVCGGAEPECRTGCPRRRVAL